MKRQNSFNKHRTTVYIDKHNKLNAEAEGLNISDFVDEHLTKRYSNVNDMQSRYSSFKIEMDVIEKEKIILDKRKIRIMEMLKEIEEALTAYNRKKEYMDKMGLSEREYNFLKEVKKRYDRDQSIMQDLRDYRETYGKEIKLEEFYELVKKIELVY